MRTAAYYKYTIKIYYLFHFMNAYLDGGKLAVFLFLYFSKASARAMNLRVLQAASVSQ